MNRQTSPEPEPDLVEAVRSALRRLTTEIDGLDGRAAAHFGVNRTDQHFIDVLASRGPLTPSELARATALSTGGVTVALDRLERAGLVRRVPHPRDRRSVLVQATERVAEAGREFFGSLAETERRLLRDYTPAQLEAIRDFLDELATEVSRHPARAGDSSRAGARSGK